MRFHVWVAISLLLASTAVASQVEQVSPPQTHNSACSLAESMAGKLGYKSKLSHDAAERTCQALSPTMDPANHAEFMRCCLQRLESGVAAPAAEAQPQRKTKKDSGN